MWERLGEGGDAQFFNADETYQEILADGAGAGPYYRLARAYIAAELNSINGAPLPDEVAGVFEEAAVVFLAADPNRLEPDTAPRLDALAEALEEFNDGTREPGACPSVPEPFSAADIGATLQGIESRDGGTIVSVDQRYDRGAGVVTIRPAGEVDEFLLPDEAFTVAGVRKAKLTTQLSDCVAVATGQQCTIAAGGQCSDPELTTAGFLGQERMMRLMVAVSEAAAEAAAVAPAAGPQGPTAPLGPAFPGAGAIGGPGSFPSPVLPTATGGAGGGFIIVPNVIGRTVAEARSIINAAQLSVGTVTIREQRAMLDVIIGVAWADDLDSATVMDQSPPAGAEAILGDPVDIAAEFSVAIPEVASLLLFATGLAFIVVVMTRRRND